MQIPAAPKSPVPPTKGTGHNDRSSIAFQSKDSTNSNPFAHADDNFFTPTKDDFKTYESELVELRQKTHIFVPTHEPTDDAKPGLIAVLNALTAKYKASNIYYIISAIPEGMLPVIKNSGVNIILQEEVEGNIDWKKVEGYTNIPSDHLSTLRGKGKTLLMGISHVLKNKPEIFNKENWIAFCDSEIKSLETYNPIDHLLYPLIDNEPDQYDQIVLAMANRDNEPMSLILNMFIPLAHRGNKIAQHILDVIGSRTWYGCGERLINAAVLKKTLFGSGYTIEVIKDLQLSGDKNNWRVAQVVNPNVRSDGRNRIEKDLQMWSQIGQTLFTIASLEIDLRNYTQDDINKINASLSELGLVFHTPFEGNKPVTYNHRFPIILPAPTTITQCFKAT